MARPGMSRAMLAAIALALAVALALLAFTSIGSYVFGALGTLGKKGVLRGQTVEVISIGIDGSGDLMVYVKNQGPDEMRLESCCDPSADWQVFVDDEPGTVGSSYIDDPGGELYFDVEEVISFRVSTAGGYNEFDLYSVVLHGPGGVRAQYLYGG